MKYLTRLTRAIVCGGVVCTKISSFSSIESHMVSICKQCKLPESEACCDYGGIVCLQIFFLSNRIPVFNAVVVVMKWSSSWSMSLSCRCHSHSSLPFSLAPVDGAPLDVSPNVLFGMLNCNSTHCGICNGSMCGRLIVVCCKQHSNEKKLLWRWSQQLLLPFWLPVRPFL